MISRFELYEEETGHISIGQTHDGKAVFIQFPQPLQCMGFSPAQARDFAAKLIEQANEIDRGHKPRVQ